MVLLESNMMPLGQQAPDFSLTDTVSGNTLSLADLKSDKATVVLFICNHCPYVVHIRDKLVELANRFQAQGVQFIAISSNDAKNYPADAPDKMAEYAKLHQFSFPYLYDESQDVARAYDATCTPDIFVFDADLACVYRGRFDGATPGNGVPVTGEDLSAALTAILNQQALPAEQIPSMGCSIKWKS